MIELGERDPMQISWQGQSGDILCRWVDQGEHVQYSADWVQEAANDVDKRNVFVGIDFDALSPFGGSEWYGLNRLRPQGLGLGGQRR